MAFEFLTDDHLERYVHFDADPTPEQLGVLGLVVNAVALRNTRYLQAALDVIGAMGEDVKAEDVARLSPLKGQHINVLGRYHFELSPDAASVDLRPLRDPEAMDILELLWED